MAPPFIDPSVSCMHRIACVDPGTVSPGTLAGGESDAEAEH
jgi:hypothetical protein